MQEIKNLFKDGREPRVDDVVFALERMPPPERRCDLNYPLLSKYPATLDEKNRIIVPSDWIFPDGWTQNLVLVPIPGGPVRAYPSILVECGKWNIPGADKGIRVALDARHRFAVPEELIQHAKIERDVMLWGIFEAFELWNPKLLQRYIRVAEATPPDPDLHI